MGVQACRLPACTSIKMYPKARSMASSRRSSLPFATFFLHNAVLDRKLVPTDRSMVYLPCLHVTGHSPFASGANVNIRFFLHNAVLDRKLGPTHRSMVYLPCLHVTGYIPFASGANVNIRFFPHNAVLHRKLVPTRRSMVDLHCLHVTGYIPFASGANVNIRFFLHNAVLDRKLGPTHRSMVYLPCLHVTGHIPFASGANVNIRFFLHNAVPHRKLVPTHRSMVDLPCLHVTGHIPFASGANINIPFRNDLRVPHLETVTTCAPVIYPARAYTAPHRLLASGTNILETLAFPLCFCFICQQRHRLRRAGIVLLFAAHFCLPVCAFFCSVVSSTLLCVRRGLLQLGDILFSFLFSFHAGSPEIGRRPHRPFTSVAVFPFTTYTCRISFWLEKLLSESEYGVHNVKTMPRWCLKTPNRKFALGEKYFIDVNELVCGTISRRGSFVVLHTGHNNVSEVKHCVTTSLDPPQNYLSNVWLPWRTLSELYIASISADESMAMWGYVCSRSKCPWWFTWVLHVFHQTC